MSQEGSEIGSGEELGHHDHAPPMRLPLNSKRLKASHLRWLVTALEVPTAALGDELRQMIDGRLAEGGKGLGTSKLFLQVPTLPPSSLWRTRKEKF